MTVTSPTRKIFYDCEFLETGSTIDLISIGLVDDTGHELYLINRDAPWAAIAEHSWLMANVVPSLPQAPPNTHVAGVDLDHLLVTPRHALAELVRSFIVDGAPGKPAEPRPAELWAWYGAFDHVVLSWLFGPMIDHPAGMPMFTCDLRQWQAQLGDPPLPDQPSGVHNALDDARHNVARWRWLDGLAAGRFTRDDMDRIIGPELGAGPRPRSATSPGDPDWVDGFGPVPGSSL